MPDPLIVVQSSILPTHQRCEFFMANRFTSLELNRFSHDRKSIRPHRLYLACYDIADPNRQRKVRHAIRQHSVTGQYSAYECELNPAQRQQLITFLLESLELGEDACGIINIRRLYWQNLPTSPLTHSEDNDLIYIS